MAPETFCVANKIKAGRLKTPEMPAKEVMVNLMFVK